MIQSIGILLLLQLELLLDVAGVAAVSHLLYHQVISALLHWPHTALCTWSLPYGELI